MTGPRMCAKCGERPLGEGAILCPSCRDAIAGVSLDDIYTEALRRAAGGGLR